MNYKISRVKGIGRAATRSFYSFHKFKELKTKIKVLSLTTSLVIFLQEPFLFLIVSQIPISQNPSFLRFNRHLSFVISKV